MFFDLASVVPDGLPLQPAAADLKKKRMADNNKDNPDAHCLPLATCSFTHIPNQEDHPDSCGHTHLVRGKRRRSSDLTDGRPLPATTATLVVRLLDWQVGRGHVVVETSGFRDGGWLDVNGSPLTDAGKMIERFRRVNVGRLDIEVTVDDRKAYTRPWTVTVISVSCLMTS